MRRVPSRGPYLVLIPHLSRVIPRVIWTYPALSPKLARPFRYSLHMRGWRLFSRRLSPRFFSSTTASLDNNAFAHTVRLPQTTFPLRRDPNKEELLRKRTCEDLYHQQVWFPGLLQHTANLHLSSGHRRTDLCLYFMTARPTLTATCTWVSVQAVLRVRRISLTWLLGHALNKILKDIINRFHLSIGERVQYV